MITRDTVKETAEKHCKWSDYRRSIWPEAEVAARNGKLVDGAFAAARFIARLPRRPIDG